MKRLFALVLAVTCIFGYSNVSASSNIISISNETDFRTAVTQGGIVLGNLRMILR